MKEGTVPLLVSTAVGGNSTDRQVMGIQDGPRAGPRGFKGQQKKKDARRDQHRLSGAQGLGKYLTGEAGEGAF